MKTILLHIHDDVAMQSRMQVALDIARTFDAHLTCIQATTQFVPITYSALGPEYVTTVNMSELHESDDLFRQKIEAHLRQEDVAWDWHAELGDTASLLIQNSALADLIVLSQSNSEEHKIESPLPITGDVAVHAHCPVLIAPASQMAFDCQKPVVIGWNGSGEAAQAMRLALPVIHCSSEVHVVTVDEERTEFPHTQASIYLARHGIRSELHQINPKNESASESLAKFAHERNAGSIVMGAYGHSRIRETLFGGVTRDLIRNSDVPLIMAH